MSYFPLLNAPATKGWTDLHNFPASKWELTRNKPRYMQLLWAAHGHWHCANLGILRAGESHRIQHHELAGLIPEDATPFLALSQLELPSRMDSLPASDLPKVYLPAWRATVGLATESAHTSYQGEVDPFPVSGTMLTFGPFLQIDPTIENYLLLLNLEKSPQARTSELEAYCVDGRCLAKFPVRNNHLNIIDLDHCGFAPDELPLFICRGMAGIPLYFSRTVDGNYLSMEHTHPPASMVLHGQRFEVQKQMKTRWLEKVGP